MCIFIYMVTIYLVIKIVVTKKIDRDIYFLKINNSLVRLIITTKNIFFCKLLRL